MTGCGCALLVALVVGMIVLMIVGSTDPGEPIEQAVAIAALVLAGALLVPRGLALVRPRDA